MISIRIFIEWNLLSRWRIKYVDRAGFTQWRRRKVQLWDPEVNRIQCHSPAVQRIEIHRAFYFSPVQINPKANPCCKSAVYIFVAEASLSPPLDWLISILIIICVWRLELNTACLHSVIAECFMLHLIRE